MRCCCPATSGLLRLVAQAAGAPAEQHFQRQVLSEHRSGQVSFVPFKIITSSDCFGWKQQLVSSPAPVKSQYVHVAGELMGLTCKTRTEQDVLLLSRRLLIKHMSVKTEQCLCRCVRLDQHSLGSIPFPTSSSPHFTSSTAGRL